MRQRKIFSVLMAAAASASMLLAPVVAKADGPARNIVKTYKDLQNLKYEYSDIEAQTNFGWPSSKTTMNLKNFQLRKSWLIPSQVTVNQNGYMGWSTEDIPLIIKGKWNIKDINHQGFGNEGYITVDKGGVLAVEKLNNGYCNFKSVQLNKGGTLNVQGSTRADNLTVKSGGIINAREMLSIGDRQVINLEKGAVVNSDNAWGLRLDGGTLNSDNAVIDGTLSISNGNDKKSHINGTLTIDDLAVFDTAYVDTALKVRKRLELYGTLVIENGAVVEIGNNRYITNVTGYDQTVKIHIKNGGKLNINSLEMMNKAEIIIDKGGEMNVAYDLLLKNKTCKITGSGTLNLKSPVYYDDGAAYKDVIASTITVNDNGKHGWDDKSSYIKNGYRYYPCIYCGKIVHKIKIATPTPKPSAEAKKGTTFKVSGLTYKITKTGTGRSVSLTKGVSGAVVSVPSKVTYKKRSYAVTSVAAKAFYNNKKLTTITIPASVKTIGTQSFANCTKLKKLNGFTKVTAVGKQAFYKCTALTQIGSKASTITLPAVQKLYSGAFQNCSKISRITISSKSLKTVESKAITGINKKTVIRVPASKLTAYKKIFKTSTGYVKTMKITK